MENYLKLFGNFLSITCEGIAFLTYRVVSPPTPNTDIKRLTIKWHSKL